MADEREQSSGFDYVVLGFILLVALLFLYYKYGMSIWFYSKYYLYSALNILPNVVIDYVFFWYDNGQYNIHKIFEMLAEHQNNYQYYFGEVSAGKSNYAAINYLSKQILIPYVVLIIFFVLYHEFRKVYSQILPMGRGHAMYDYAKSQSDIWVYIKIVAPIMKKIAKSKSLDKGWYAMSKMPLMFLKENDLMNVIHKERKKLITIRERKEFTINRKKTYKILVENLGKKWTGLDDLTFVEKCVLAVIIPHVYGRVKESRLMNRKICLYLDPTLSKKEKTAMEVNVKQEVESIIDRYKEAFSTPYFDETDFEDAYDPILMSFEEISTEEELILRGDKLIRETLLTHAYKKTVFFSLIEKSWTYGVLSSSELLWVKSIDRDLFYVLSQQGRLSAFVEVCGAWSHFLAESTFGFKMHSPQVYNGFRSLDHYMWKTHNNYTPFELWEDNDKWDRLVPDVYQSSNGLAQEDKSITSTNMPM